MKNHLDLLLRMTWHMAGDAVSGEHLRTDMDALLAILELVKELDELNDQCRQAKEFLTASEVARTDLGKRLTATQKELAEVRTLLDKARPCSVCERNVGRWSSVCRECDSCRNEYHPYFSYDGRKGSA